MEQEVKRLVFKIIYTATLTILISYLWWGPYQNSLQSKNLNQTIDFQTEGFEEVVIAKEQKVQDITIKNIGMEESFYTIAFMVEDGKENPNTNKNNYVQYFIIDEDGNRSDQRNLGLDGNIYTSKLEYGEEKHYQIVLWSEEEFDLRGRLSLLANPVL